MLVKIQLLYRDSARFLNKKMQLRHLVSCERFDNSCKIKNIQNDMMKLLFKTLCMHAPVSLFYSKFYHAFLAFYLPTGDFFPIFILILSYSC